MNFNFLYVTLFITFVIGSSGIVAASNLPSCPEYRHSIDSPWHDCFGSFTYENGDRYLGEFRNDKRVGVGVYTFADGTEKEGYWNSSCYIPILPRYISNLESRQPKFYPNSDHGVSITFKTGKPTASLFVYNLGLESLHASDVEQQLILAVRDIVQRYEGYENETLNSPMILSKDEIGLGHMKTLISKAVFFTSSDGTKDKLEFLTLGSNHNCFLKVRYTTPINSSATNDIIAGVLDFSAFMRELNSALLKAEYY